MNTVIEWRSVQEQLPPENEVVYTRIDDGLGIRNEAPLKRHGRLWFLQDGSMYVYYTPTHWKPIPCGGESI